MTFYIGVNYWPEVSNIKFWSRWNPEEIENDFAKMREIGINAIRTFLLDEDCAYNDGRLKEDCKIKIKQFLDIAEKYGIKVFLTFIVGHMSGKNWPIPWDPNNEIYSSKAIENAKKFITQVVENFKNHKAIGGWILSNEITLVKKPSSVEEFKLWVSSLYHAIKDIDRDHLVSIGDSVSLYSQPYLKPENLRGIIDYASPHLYRYDEDPIRHTLTYESVLEYCRSSGIPTLLEEFGYPTSLYSEESQAGFIDIILHSALFYGTIGAFIWCFSDFKNESDEPYLWEPHELTFGIFRKDLSRKPSANVVEDFTKFLKSVKLEEYRLPKREAAIIVPSFLYKDFPFVGEVNMRDDIAKLLSQSFTIARLSGINVTFVREEEEFSNYKLILIPSISRLLTSTWKRLLDFVENGGVVYYSTLIPGYHMSATHMWEELFGVKPNLNAGGGGLILPEDIEVEFLERFGSIKMGEKIRVEGSSISLKTYRFKEVDAKVIAHVPSHEFNIYLAKRGKGFAVLSNIPFEGIILTSMEGKNYNMGILKFYRSLAEVSNIEIKYFAEPAGVEVVYMEGENEDLVGILNHTFEDKEALIYYPSGYTLIDVDIKDNPLRLKLKEKSTHVLRIKKQ
ncbi:MAG: DUF4434 domain-containing protein [Sulfolobaceae archaeon]|nr:DUF4434 domain-containing protein [Sulfolobaceae archaeon]QFQ13828.1 exomannanase [uncultured archaeon]